jgi:hypothetical protein
MEKCKYNDNGNCTGQKCAPKCYYDLHDDCKKYKPVTRGISVDIKTELDWEKICRYLIYNYGIDEEEVGNYIRGHITEYVDIKVDI